MKFQYQLIDSKYKNLLDKELSKKEIQEGLIQAVDLIDAIIALLRNCKSQPDAKKALMTGELGDLKFKERDQEFIPVIREFCFTERQAQAILDMRLSKLIGLELLQLTKEHKETLKRIREYQSILSSREKANALLSQELDIIKKEFAVPRRTLIEDGREAVYDESAVEEMDVFYVQDKFGYVKLLDTATYQRNQEAVDSENRFVIPCKNTDRLLIFTDRGMLHQLKLMDVPLCKFKDKGVPIDNISKYSANEEEILAVLVKRELAGKSLIFLTKQGFVKRVDAAEFDTTLRCVSAAKLQPEDLLAAVKVYNGESDVVFVTEQSCFLRCAAEEIPLQKKTAKGVTSMALGRNDELEDIYLLGTEPVDIEVSGKTLSLNRLRLSKRGGKGTKH